MTPWEKRKACPGWRAERDRLIAQRKRGAISVAQVRAEGIVELGMVPDTSIAYVVTGRGMRLFHVDYIISRGVRC